MSYIFFIENKCSEELLKEKIANFYILAIDQIGFLNYEYDQGTPINIEIDSFEGDVHTRLSVYVDTALIEMRQIKEVDLALFLAKELKTNIIISHWSSNPFLWILIDPYMLFYEVKEIPTDREFFMQLNRSYRKELTLKTIKLLKNL